jgi:hypothetical protein
MVTEQQLTELCRQYRATLRKRTKKGRKSPAYEAYRDIAGKTYMVYLLSASKLPEADTEAIRAKLAKLQE